MPASHRKMYESAGIEGDERGVKSPGRGAKCHILLVNSRQHDACTCQATAGPSWKLHCNDKRPLLAEPQTPLASNSPHHPCISIIQYCQLTLRNYRPMLSGA